MPAAPEDLLTAWIRRRVAAGGNDLIGDDAAFLPDGRSAISVDQQVEGVHFPAALPAAAVGKRLVSVCLSDVAAIGGLPRYGVLAVAAPAHFALRPFLAAVGDALAAVGAELAGGDLARSDRLVTSLTLLARRPPRHRWLRRDAGRPGDRLWVAGSLGESAVGRHLLASGARFTARGVELPPDLAGNRPLAIAARRAVRRHIEPAAQLDLGRWLARRRRAAAIDISDGLLLDLERLCRASRVGATLDAARIPAPKRFDDLATAIGWRASDLALAGGEDYLLLCALPPGLAPPPSFGAAAIGTLRDGSGVRLVGAPRPSRTGWDHLATT